MQDITRAVQLLHGEEEVVFGDAGNQGIEKRAEMAGKSTTIWGAMRPVKRRVLLDTPNGRLLDLLETDQNTAFCLE